MSRGWWAASLGVLSVCGSVAHAEPFVVVPILRVVGGELAIGTDPGHELLVGNDRRFRWAAAGSSGDAALGVSSVAIAIAGSIVPALDVQATASRWGTTFYRERRSSLAVRLKGAVSVSPLVEVRDVRVADVDRFGWGIGARFGVARGSWHHTFTWTAGARGGARDLFDGALLVSTSFTRHVGWVKGVLELGGHVGGRIAAGVPIGGWHAGASLEVTAGGVGVWLGRGSGHLAFTVEGTHVPHVGLTRHVTVWGER